MLSSKNIRNALGALLAALLSFLFLFYRLELWSYPLSVPLGFQGDGLLPLMLSKTINTYGWFVVDPSLSAPAIFNLADYPLSSDSFNMLIMKVMGWFLPDHFYVVNLFFLLRFPVIAAVSFACIRALGVRISLAIALGVLYSFIPHNIIRGQGHLFLGTYFVLPPLILLLVKIAREEIVISLKNPSFWAWSLFCICLAGSGVYFAFFGCFLFACVALLKFFSHSKKRFLAVWPSIYYCGVVTFTTVVLALPSLFYWLREGKNPEMTGRLAWESELYGLKIIQLILPISNHYLASFRRYTDTYNRSAPLVTENSMACIGLVASAGFAMLLLYAVLRAGGFAPKSTNAHSTQAQTDFGTLSYLNIFAVLLGTIGGLGTIFNYAIFREIRAYNRLSIFIAFFGIAAVALVLERVFGSKKWISKTSWVFASIIMSFGLFDQTGLIGLRWSEQIESFKSEKRFSEQIEASVPAQSGVFQLPVIPFPESPSFGKMIDYEHLKQSLLTKNLKWTYPAMRGRPPFLWQKEVSELPIEDFLYRIWDKGFKGVYIDLHGYSDGGVALLKRLQAKLGLPTVVSENGRRVFFAVNLPIQIHYNDQGLPTSVRQLSKGRVDFLPKLLNSPNIQKRLGLDEITTVVLDPNADFDLGELARLRARVPKALTARGFKARLSCSVVDPKIDAEDLRVKMTLTNTGAEVWPSTGEGPSHNFAVRVRPSTLGQDGKIVDRDLAVGISQLPQPVLPGESVTLVASVPASYLKTKDKRLQFDLVQEGVGWFADHGNQPCVLKSID